MPTAKRNTLYHALFLAQHLSKCDIQDGLVYILLELRVPCHCLGYHYVRMAILLFYQDPVHTLLTGITQSVMEQFSSALSYGQVEQAMRSVIDQAYKNCDPQLWGYYFHTYGKRKSGRPTNSEFVTQIANFMELWQACCKEVSYEI